MDSRSSMAGSSARMPLTISILLDDSQRGISANLCVHLRARTGSVEVATMGSCVRKSASALFGLVGLQACSAN